MNGNPLLETRQPRVLRGQALDRFQARERRDVVIGIRQPRGFRDERLDTALIAAAFHEPRDRAGGRHQRHDRRRHDEPIERRRAAGACGVSACSTSAAVWYR